MNAIVQFVLKHGYSILFAAVFAHQIDLPVPGPLFLLAAGALAASGRLNLAVALGLAIIACLMADMVWYEAGRRWGDRVLHFIHRLAPDPDAAERRSRRNFARYGPRLLVLAKFVPGLDAVLPPMAGASGTSRLRFLGLDTFGGALCSAAYAGLGYVLSHDLDSTPPPSWASISYRRRSKTTAEVEFRLSLISMSTASKLSSSRNLPLMMYWSTRRYRRWRISYVRFRERVPLTGHCSHVGSRCGQNEFCRSTLSLRFQRLATSLNLARYLQCLCSGATT